MDIQIGNALIPKGCIFLGSSEDTYVSDGTAVEVTVTDGKDEASGAAVYDPQTHSNQAVAYRVTNWREPRASS
jgi:hypothetical protein